MGGCRDWWLDGRDILCLLIWQVKTFVYTSLRWGLRFCISHKLQGGRWWWPCSTDRTLSSKALGNMWAGILFIREGSLEEEFRPGFFVFVFVFLINLFMYLFYFWLCWVFVSVRGLSLITASGGHSSSRCADLSPSRPLSFQGTGSRRAGSVVVAHGPSCSAACGIFPDQGCSSFTEI